MLYKDDDETYSEDFSSKVGFHFGPIVGFTFTDWIGLQTGTILSTKGFKWVEEPNDYEKYSLTLNSLYLEIPVFVKFIIPAGGINILADVGPCLGIGMGGKWTDEYTYEGDTDSDTEKIDWGSGDNDDLKRMDLGLHVGAGVQIKFIIIGVHYNLGLMNVSPFTENGAKIANRTFGFSVGMLFGAGGGGGGNRND
jgi:hypothetical protein